MTTPAATTDHTEQALALLIEQYRGLPDIGAWVASYTDEVQFLEDSAVELLWARTIEQAEGDLLRKLGTVVRQPWGGEGDEDYRRLVMARVRVNRSHGQWADLHAVAGILFGDACALQVTSAMSVALRVTDALTKRPDIEQWQAEAAAAAGVRVDVIYHTDAPESRFVFGSDGAGFDGGGLAGRVSSWSDS